MSNRLFANMSLGAIVGDRRNSCGARLLVMSVWLAAHDPLFPIRILAGVALVAVIAAFVHVLRHLNRIEREVVADDLVPKERGPRNNMVLVVTAIPIVVMILLLYLILKA